jgi:hypothetical protein
MKSVFEKRNKLDDALTSGEAVECILQLVALYHPIQTTIVIDGLDEVDPKYAQDLRTSIARLLQESKGKGLLKVFIASRPDRWISDWLEAWQALEVTPDKSDCEIKHYIRFEVDRRLNDAVSGELKDKIKEVLMARAKGM